MLEFLERKKTRFGWMDIYQYKDFIIRDEYIPSEIVGKDYHNWNIEYSKNDLVLSEPNLTVINSESEDISVQISFGRFGCILSDSEIDKLVAALTQVKELTPMLIDLIKNKEAENGK